MGKSFKSIIKLGLCIVMMLSLGACGQSEDWVFLLHGEKIYKQDVAAFAYIYAMEYNINDVEQLEEIYEDTTTYGEFYKQQLEDDIVSVVLLYKEADTKHVKLSDEAKEQIQASTSKVMERFGKDVLEEAGVSKADIENVYEMKMLGNTYLDGLLEGEKEGESLESSSDEEDRYIKVYQVTFPTVELDDDGMVQSDADGNLKKLSATEISDREQEAISFVENAKNGEDIESLLQQCDSDVSGIEKYLKYDDLEKNYKSAVDEMSVGEISDVIEADYGFYVIRLLEKDDAEFAGTVSNHEKESEGIAVQEEELERLYSEYAQPNKGYKNTGMWDLIDIKDYIK